MTHFHNLVTYLQHLLLQSIYQHMSHPYQCEITGISDSVFTEQRVQFTITIKSIDLTIVEDAVNAQLDKGRGNIQLVSVKRSDDGKYRGSF